MQSHILTGLLGVMMGFVISPSVDVEPLDDGEVCSNQHSRGQRETTSCVGAKAKSQLSVPNPCSVAPPLSPPSLHTTQSCYVCVSGVKA